MFPAFAANGAERCVTCRPDYDGLADVSPVTPLLATRISLSGPDGATQSPLQPVPLECSRSQSVRRIGYIVARWQRRPKRVHHSPSGKPSLTAAPWRGRPAGKNTIQLARSRRLGRTGPKLPEGRYLSRHGHNKENTASIRFIETDLHPNERYLSPTFDVPYL